MNKLSLRDLKIGNERVLMRVDFNVPLNSDGTIADDTRIKEALPSIQFVLQQGGALVLMSHLGRPEGGKNAQYSLEPCCKRLQELLGKPIIFAKDCVGKEVEAQASSLKKGEILFLENLRFHPEEEDPSLNPGFAQDLAKLGTVFVNDAFGTAHRKHASTYAVAEYFKGKSALGFLMEKEVTFLSNLLTQAKKPFFALIGGAKISSKLGALKSLLNKVDALFIGGGMAYTFLKAQGIAIGASIHEDAHLSTAQELLKDAARKKIKILLPKDIVAADSYAKDATSKVFTIEEGIPEGWQGMDIGPQTIREWALQLKKAQTIFWNGPFGVFEFPSFSKGTKAIAETLSHLKATTIVGGGDTVAAINQLKLAPHFTHISTGGGASLEFLELGSLPGIDILSSKF